MSAIAEHQDHRTDYSRFILSKTQASGDHGFAPLWTPDFLFDFQKSLIEWAIRKGRAAIFADCGLGKTAMQLVWAENVVRKTNGNVLILTPLAVSGQTCREAEKFGIEAKRSHDGTAWRGITITNYEQLHKFDAGDFAGVVCDECFPPDTLIDVLSIDAQPQEKYIKDIRKGDKIINAAGVDIVSDVHRREVSYAVRIRSCGRVITSSPNHPYFTQRGWVGAIDLRPGDHIMEAGAGMRLVQDGFYSKNSPSENDQVLREILLSEMAHVTTGESIESTRYGGCKETWGEEVSVVEVACRTERNGADCSSQPNEQSINQGEGEPHIESDEPQTFRAWGKRQAFNAAAANLDECVITDMDCGISFITGPIKSGIPDALQAGLSVSRAEARNRGGWKLALQSESAGPEKRCHAGFVRVDGIEVLEQGHSDLEKYRDADGKLYFYDLGGTRHPSFSVGGLLVHNSSILKSFDGARKQEITIFMRQMPYRLLATATAAPNDFIELGTSSEALGYLGHMDMLNRFFKNDLNNSATGRMHGNVAKWRFKGHSELPFWRWVCSWARAMRKPSDLGFDDGRFLLPPLMEEEHLVESEGVSGYLFNLPAITLNEQRQEARQTLDVRCNRVAELVNHTGQPALVWCHLNDEGDLLEKLISDAVQVAGSDRDEDKEERFTAFSEGQARVLITKPKIGAWGLNFQHCNHVLFFPSHSFEQYYQGVRRCWRFGQQRPVKVDIVTTEGGQNVLSNLQRKAAQADQMFSNLVDEMNHAISLNRGTVYNKPMEVPTWLSSIK